LRSAATRRDDHPDERVRVAFGRPSPVSLQHTAAEPQRTPEGDSLQAEPQRTPEGPTEARKPPEPPEPPEPTPRRKAGPLAREGALLSLAERRSARALRHPHVGARARRRLRR